jgi:hypothetical protein
VEIMAHQKSQMDEKISSNLDEKINKNKGMKNTTSKLWMKTFLLG